MRRKTIAVLGAGAVGVGVAVYLQQDGHDVTLIDQEDPGSGASAGNAGLIQCTSVVPIATPHTLRSTPRMLLDPNQPLVIKWSNLPSLAPYLLSFLAEAFPGRVAHNSRALASIIPRAYEAYKPLIAAAGAQDMLIQCGELHVFETDAAFHAAKPLHKLRRSLGVEVEFLNGYEARAMEPALSHSVRWAVHMPEVYLTSDPKKFVARLAQHFVSKGGFLKRAHVRNVTIASDGHVELNLDSAETMITEEAVIALGAFSGPITKQLGDRVILNSERGYHVMLPQPAIALHGGIISGEHRFAISPIDGGVRLAGTAELARIGAPPDYGRANRLLPLAQRLLPGLSAQNQSVWMGHRPSTPDSLPVIGRSPRHPQIYYAFGHGHCGLTLGGMTGSLIADQAANRPTTIDMAPFSIERFKRRRFSRAKTNSHNRGCRPGVDGMPEYHNQKKLRHRGDSVVHLGVAYISGVVPEDNNLPVAAQTELALAEIERRLAEAGTDKSQLLSATIWMRDVNRDVGALNKVWNSWVVAGREPARACVGADLQNGAMLEISIIAAVDV